MFFGTKVQLYFSFEIKVNPKECIPITPWIVLKIGLVITVTKKTWWEYV